jgi:hypothetical protein
MKSFSLSNSLLWFDLKKAMTHLMRVLLKRIRVVLLGLIFFMNLDLCTKINTLCTGEQACFCSIHGPVKSDDPGIISLWGRASGV